MGIDNEAVLAMSNKQLGLGIEIDPPKEGTRDWWSDALVDHYKTYKPRSNPGRKEHAKIQARLKEGYTYEQLKMAIDGCFLSEFHDGKNKSGQKYQSLELIMRDASHVDQFIGIYKDQKSHETYSKRQKAASKRKLSAVQIIRDGRKKKLSDPEIEAILKKNGLSWD